MLENLRPDNVIEIVGFGKTAMKEFIGMNVPEEQKVHVEKVVHDIQPLAAMSSLPFYCSQLCKLLQDPSLFIGSEFRTLTRLVSHLVLVSSQIVISTMIFRKEIQTATLNKQT